MSHFYATVEGTGKTVATKTGTKHTGLEADIRGWHSGVRVVLTYNEQTGQDEILVYQTEGSKGKGQGSNPGVLIAEIGTTGKKVDLAS